MLLVLCFEYRSVNFLHFGMVLMIFYDSVGFEIGRGRPSLSPYRRALLKSMKMALYPSFEQVLKRGSVLANRQSAGIVGMHPPEVFLK